MTEAELKAFGQEVMESLNRCDFDVQTGGGEVHHYYMTMPSAFALSSLFANMSHTLSGKKQDTAGTFVPAFGILWHGVPILIDSRLKDGEIRFTDGTSVHDWSQGAKLDGSLISLGNSIAKKRKG